MIYVIGYVAVLVFGLFVYLAANYMPHSAVGTSLVVAASLACLVYLISRRNPAKILLPTDAVGLTLALIMSLGVLATSLKMRSVPESLLTATCAFLFVLAGTTGLWHVLKSGREK